MLYLAAHNDLLNNLTIKRVYRLYSKPVMVFDSGETSVRNRPAERMPKNAYPYLEYGEKGKINHLQGIRPGGDGLVARIKEFLKSHTALYYPLRYAHDRWDAAARADLEPEFRSADLRVKRGILRRMGDAAGTLYVSANPLTFAGSRSGRLEQLAAASTAAGAHFVDISASLPGDPST